ncbi:hypothetical protein GJV26_25155 [Massilia dura]|uniref:Uncharacterized protein n=1 Tax=Pseudoduganella dura TaxID=321982 RepID=A0A6I3XGU2_9BURK|nr:hypothetical protein [Pseudoduganella dura]MUI15717.1 hypothetical protein [Pseudoduganella dura]GGX88875.1 hypothetical protein GCM10007386_19550 [Pseudoduganella dura]
MSNETNSLKNSDVTSMPQADPVSGEAGTGGTPDQSPPTVTDQDASAGYELADQPPAEPESAGAAAGTPNDPPAVSADDVNAAQADFEATPQFDTEPEAAQMMRSVADQVSRPKR